MTKFLTRRLAHFVFLLWAVSSLTFCLIHLIPGDPAVHILGQGADREDIGRLRHELGLDVPVLEKYLYFQKSLLTLDLGISLVNRKKVLRNIMVYLPRTVVLSLAALALALVLSFVLGYAAAFRENSAIDHLATLISSLGIALPAFLLGPLLIFLFSVRLGWLPVSGSDGNRHLILPALTLAFSLTAYLTRIIKTSLVREMGRPYVVLARSKGLSERKIFFKYILKNALSPVVSALGLQLGALLSGAVITETVFSWQGIGSLLLKSIASRDYPMVQGLVLFIVSVYIFLHLLIDLAYLLIDPRQLNEIKKSQ